MKNQAAIMFGIAALALLLSSSLAFASPGATSGNSILYMVIQQPRVFTASFTSGNYNVRVDPNVPVTFIICVQANASLLTPHEIPDKLSVRMSITYDGGVVWHERELNLTGVATYGQYYYVNKTGDWSVPPPKQDTTYVCTVNYLIHNGTNWDAVETWVFTVTGRTLVEKAMERTMGITVWIGSALLFFLTAAVIFGSFATRSEPSTDDILLMFAIAICVVICLIAFNYYFQLY
ncbi:MAG: hypothetical protein QW764_03000 [Desulfurococcaceae archaeon]